MSTNLEGVKEELSEARQGVSRGLNGINGKDNKRIRDKFSELSSFMANPKLFAALEKVGNDKEAFRQAKANPGAYLKNEGLVLPRGTDVKIMYSKKKTKPKPKPTTYNVDLVACLGPFCLKVKGTITKT